MSEKPQKQKYCMRCGQTMQPPGISANGYWSCANDGCGYVFWDNPKPVLAAIVEYGDSVILVQNVGWPKEWYGLVTGFLEKGETPEQCIVREVQEELGLAATVEGFVGIYSFFERNELILAYHLKATGTITKGEELADFKVVPIDKVKPWPFATGLALADWLAKRGV